MALLVSRVLHAGYIFEHAKTKIIFDPIFENPFSRNCFAFPTVKFDTEAIQKLKFDAIFISHYHDDHCSLQSLNLIRRDTPLYLYCAIDELFDLIKEMGFMHVYSLHVNSEVKINSITVIPRLALDPEVDTIFEIRAGQTKILNVVDAWIDPSALEILKTSAPWDLVLWPFQTMLEIQILSPHRMSKYKPELPHEWIEQLKELRPKNIIPSSCQFVHEDWSWYNRTMFPLSYKLFAETIRMALPDSSVVRLDPSNSIKIEAAKIEVAPSLKWAKRTDNHVVDYNYNPPSTFQETSQIAKRFFALTDKQVQTVFNYCEQGLIQILNKIGFSSESYFNKTRYWRLSLFDHRGEATHFYYKIADQQIQLVENINFSPSWTTELPMTKLYLAVTSGETTTSMYIRINDKFFDEKIESELQNADLLSDPLICALSYQSEITYQKAQFKELNAQNKLKKSGDCKIT